MPHHDPMAAPLVEERVSLSVDDDALPAVHDALERFWRDVDGAVRAGESRAWRVEFSTALLEIAANILRHAYPPGQLPAWFSLHLSLFPDFAEAVLTDSGVVLPMGLPVLPLPNPLVVDWVEIPEDGMGLAVAQAALDELEYERSGDANIWRLVKRTGAT